MLGLGVSIMFSVVVVKRSYFCYGIMVEKLVCYLDWVSWMRRGYLCSVYFLNWYSV